jgi:hypothetical protein
MLSPSAIHLADDFVGIEIPTVLPAPDEAPEAEVEADTELFDAEFVPPQAARATTITTTNNTAKTLFIFFPLSIMFILCYYISLTFTDC